VGSAVGLIRDNALHWVQLRVVARSSPKYMAPVESINTFIVRYTFGPSARPVPRLIIW
jgi:hypothetical protein